MVYYLPHRQSLHSIAYPFSQKARFLRGRLFLQRLEASVPKRPSIPPAITLVEKTALVTGSNVGLVLDCARHFLKLRPNRLVMAVLSLQKGKTASVGLRAKFVDVRTEVW
jgi:hypothetical protein